MVLKVSYAHVYQPSHVVALCPILQIEVETVDKTGTFLGSLFENKVNVGVALLENGLAKLHPNFDPSRTASAVDLQRAEEKARTHKIKVSGVFQCSSVEFRLVIAVSWSRKFPSFVSEVRRGTRRQIGCTNSSLAGVSSVIKVLYWNQDDLLRSYIHWMDSWQLRVENVFRIRY